MLLEFKYVGGEGRRRRLNGKRGRGTLADEKPPTLGLLQRSGEVLIRMLPNGQQVTIKPVLMQVIQPGSLLYTDEYDIYTRLEEWGISTRRSIIRRANMRVMKMAMAFMKCMSIPWKGSGRCCALDCVPIAASRTHRLTAAQQRTWAEKLPLYLGFFEFVHNARQRGKALLSALLAVLVAP